MSTNHDGKDLDAAGVPELTALGKRIELLRIERRMSKSVLAQRAGTSRQQLWRVMTGKSELTSSLCARLAEVLEIDSRALRDAGIATGATRFGAVPSADGRGWSELDFGSTLRDAALSRHPRRSRDDEGAGEGHDASASDTLCQTLEAYVSAPEGLERTFRTLPRTDDGRRLKRALLNAVEDLAASRSIKLPTAFFDLRRRVVNDEN